MVRRTFFLISQIVRKRVATPPPKKKNTYSSISLTDTHHKSAEFTLEQQCTFAIITNWSRFNLKILQGLVKNFHRTQQNFTLSEISLSVLDKLYCTF